MKLRTHKTSAKRLGVTGSGKLTRTTTNAHHLRDNKSARQLAAAKNVVLVATPDLPKLKRLIPNR
jgi:ribosomal protein L35